MFEGITVYHCTIFCISLYKTVLSLQNDHYTLKVGKYHTFLKVACVETLAASYFACL